MGFILYQFLAGQKAVIAYRNQWLHASLAANLINNFDNVSALMARAKLPRVTHGYSRAI